MTILYEPAAPAANLLVPLLGPEAAVVSAGAALVHRLTVDPAEAVVLVGPGAALAEAGELARECLRLRPRLGVILLRQRVDDAALAEARRSGIREVVRAADRDGIATAVARCRPAAPRAAEPAERPGDGRVIAVFSGKGGAGKSVVATNLAEALATGGRRVCLIDLDLTFGDVGILLQLAPDRTLADAIGVADRLDHTGLRMLLTPYQPNLDVLLAPVEPAAAERIDRRLVGAVLALARSSFDLVVVDCASQFSEPVLAALDAAHFHVLVATPELPALKNLRVTLDMFDLLDYRRDGRLVVLNRAESRVGLSSADAENVLRTPISAYVPSSREVPVSVNRGIPLVRERPNHPVSAAVRELAARHFTATAGSGVRGLRKLVGRRGEPRGRGSG